MANATKIVQKRSNSGYTASLYDEACRVRYAQTLSLLNGTDPYEETQWEDDVNTYLGVTYMHIVNACTSFFILVRTQGINRPHTRDKQSVHKG